MPMPLSGLPSSSPRMSSMSPAPEASHRSSAHSHSPFRDENEPHALSVSWLMQDSTAHCAPVPPAMSSLRAGPSSSSPVPGPASSP